jgi:hypothetical protein
MANQLNPESTAEPSAAQLSDIGNRLRAVEIDVAVIKSNYATREDVANLGIKTQESISSLEIRTAQMEARLIKWFIGTAITLSAVVGTIAFTAAKFIH